jgi:hypothetical protein
VLAEQIQVIEVNQPDRGNRRRRGKAAGTTIRQMMDHPGQQRQIE